MWRTPGDAERLARGRSRRGARRPLTPALTRDPRHRDLLRRHLRRGASTATATLRANVDLLPGRARPLRRRRARARIPPPSRADQRRGRRRARPGRCVARRHRRWSASPAAPAWSARCSSAFRPRRALAAARRLPLAPVDHLQGHVAANFLPGVAFEPPFVCLIASGGHTLLADVRDHARVRGARPDARRRRGRGLRQGRAAARPAATRAGRRSSALPREGDPRAFDFPTAAGRRRTGLLLRRAEDRAALQGSATSGRSEAQRRGAPTSPPPTSTRSSRRWRRGSSAPSTASG